MYACGELLYVFATYLGRRMEQEREKEKGDRGGGGNWFEMLTAVAA